MSERGRYNVSRKLYVVPIHLSGKVVVEATSAQEAREMARDSANHLAIEVFQDTDFVPKKTGITCLGKSPILYINDPRKSDGLPSP